MPQELAVVTTSQACDRVLEVRGGGPEVNPVTRHVKCPISTTPRDVLGWDTYFVKLEKQSPWKPAEMTTGKSRKHRPEPQGADGQTEETDQVRCKAKQVDPPRTPWAPTEPNARGDATPQEQPHAKDWNRQRRHGARGATLRTGSTNETDAKKRRKARSGQSRRASSRPTAEADKDPTKKERGMEWATPTGPQTEEQTRDRRRTPEGEESRR